jgi:hypothetical protein
MVPGAAFGSIVSSSELQDLEAWGAWYDAVTADDEIVSILGQLRGQNTPYVTSTGSAQAAVPRAQRARGTAISHRSRRRRTSRSPG